MRRKLILMHVGALIVSALLTTVLLLVMISRNQASMPRHSCDMSGIAYVFGLAVNVLLFVTACSCYLNLYRGISRRFFYSFLSFLLLPLVTAIVVIVAIEELSRETLAMVVPFLFLQTIQFFRFRKWLDRRVAKDR